MPSPRGIHLQLPKLSDNPELFTYSEPSQQGHNFVPLHMAELFDGRPAVCFRLRRWATEVTEIRNSLSPDHYQGSG